MLLFTGPNISGGRAELQWMLQRKARKPIEMSIVESGTSGRIMGGYAWGSLEKMLSIFLFLSALTQGIH